MTWLYVLIAVFCGGAGASAGAFLLRYRRHECDWEVTGAQPAAGMIFASGTVVLWHCRTCPEVRTTEIQGKWTIEQVTCRVADSGQVKAVAG